jgi:hypothetical protein
LAEIFERHRSAAVPSLPAPLARYQSTINRLLAKKPEDRYPSAAHVLEALDAISGPIATQSRRAGQKGDLDS